MQRIQIRVQDGSLFNSNENAQSIQCPVPTDSPTSERSMLRQVREAHQRRKETLAALSRAWEINGVEGVVDKPRPARDESRAEDEGKWTFRPGESAFAGHTFDISGKEKVLLETFAHGEGPVTAEDLVDLCWPDSEIETETLRSHISHLRSRLRREYRLRRNVDPIPRVDRGERLAWRLDSSVLLATQRRFNENTNTS